MPKRSRSTTAKTQTGCRPSQLFGTWLCKMQALNEMVGYARANPIPAATRAPAVINKRKNKAAEDAADADVLDDDEEGEFYAPSPCYPVEDGIARLTISGPMTKYPTSYQQVFGGTSTVLLRQAVRDIIAKRSEIRGTLCEISSPGGTVAGTQPLAEDFYQLAQVMPLVIHASDDIDSAALWVGSQGNIIFADPMTWVGSIGARGALIDSSGQYELEGLKVYWVANSGGDYKLMGADGAPVPAEHVEQLQRELDDTFSLFLAGVARGRQMPVDAIRPYADGRVFIASDALEIGLIDRVGTIDEAMTYIKQVSSSQDGRSRLTRITTPAAELERSDAMPLTPGQLTRAKAIPALASVADADAPDKLIELAGRVPGLESELVTAQRTITTLTGERDAAQKNAPKAMDAEVRDARRDVYVARIDALAAAGKINQGQRGKAAAMIGGKIDNGAIKLDTLDANTSPAVERVVAKGADGRCVMDATLDLFTDATAARQPGEQTGHQPQVPPPAGQQSTALNDPHQQGDDKAKKPEAVGQAQGQTYAQQLLAQRGIKTT